MILKKILIIATLMLFIACGVEEEAQIKIHNGNFVASLVISSDEFDSLNSTSINSAEGTENAKKVAQKVYQKFKDEFDFIFIHMNNTAKPDNMPYGEFLNVSNNINGLGISIFNNTTQYGSSGKLKGIIGLYNNIGAFDIGPILHEMLHNWANYQPSTSAYYGGGHWPSSYGHKGKYTSSGNTFSPLELYFMGMIGTPTESPTDWARGTYYRYETSKNHEKYTADADIGKTLFDAGGVLSGRESYTTSQKEFRALFLIISKTEVPEALVSEGTKISKDANYNKKIEWITTTTDIAQKNRDYQLYVNNFHYDTNFKGTLIMGNLDQVVK